MTAGRLIQPSTARGLARFGSDPVLVAIFGPPLVLFVWFITPLGGATVQLQATWLVLLSADVMFALLSRRVARMAGLPAGARRFWYAMCLAGVCFTIGDSYETGLALLRPAESSAVPGTFEQACVTVGVTGVVWTLLTYPSGVATRRERVRFWLDSITVLASVAVFVWYFTYEIGAAQHDLATRVGVPVAAGVLLVAVFGGIRVLFGDSPLTPGGGIVGMSAAAGQWLVTVLPDLVLTEPHPRLQLALHLVPPALIAATPRIQELQMLANPRSLSRRRVRPYSVLAYVAMAATLGLLVASLLTKIDLRVWGVVAGVVFIVAAVVIRQLDAFAENATLLRQLDTSMLDLRQQEQRFRSLVQHASDVVLIADAAGTVTYASPATDTVLGLAPDDHLGRPIFERVHPDDATMAAAQLAAAAAAPGTVVDYEVRLRHRAGDWRWLHVISTNLLDEPSVAGIVCNARDVTEARQLRDRLRHDASHDSLTGLANRALFHEMLSTAPGSTRELAVLLIDLDGFKQINDVYGHHVGDELLIVTADRLRACAAERDTVARLGGDEFAILLPGVDAAGAEVVAERIRIALAAPATVAGHALRPRASVGAAAGRAEEAAELLHVADAAMYRRKRGAADGFPAPRESADAARPRLG